MGIFKGRLADPLRKTLRKMRKHYPYAVEELAEIEKSDKLLAKLERQIESNQTNEQRQLLALGLDSSDEPRRGRVLLAWLWENREKILEIVKMLGVK